LILEVGSGSGRFTEQAASTGAMVVSLDYSHAVDANYKTNGSKENVFILQGDIYSMPLKKGIFDKLICIGVLQHTPNPRKAFLVLPAFLKKSGCLVVDIYKKGWKEYLICKRYIRPFTRMVDPRKLYNMIQRYVDFMWPLCGLIRKIPKIGPMIIWGVFGIADYSRRGLKGQILKEWAYLDTFDMFAPRYDYPKTISEVKRWFEESGLIHIDVKTGYNGVEGRGLKH